MNEQPTPIAGPAPATATPERLVSLDAVRGLTLAGMILVNNAGNWNAVYGPLRHADWHGWTPTDLVFPSFLFIVGAAIPLSFDKRIASGFGRLRLFEQVLRRTIILFLLGLILGLTPNGFPDWRLIGPYIGVIVALAFLYADEPPFGRPATRPGRIRKVIGWGLLAAAVLCFALDFRYFQASHLRLPGVLQRIAICYFIASVIVMYSGPRGRFLWMAALLLGYWAIVAHVRPAPAAAAGTPATAAASAPTGTRTAGAPAGAARAAWTAARPEGVLHDRIDEAVLGSHLYRERPDPEGILSTAPAVATVLLGVLAAGWLQGRREKTDKAFGLFLAANVALFLGLWMNLSFPINKKIWTSSYVLLAGGISLHVLAMCYYLIDIKGRRRWAAPFLVFGTNAIAVYFASSAFGRLLNLWRLPTADGHTVAGDVAWGTLLRTWGYQTLHPLWTPTPLGPQTITLKTWLYDSLFASWASPRLASLLYALAYVLLWLILTTPLYRRRIFIKV